jgi:restriction system protein
MAVPDFQTIMLPLLKLAADGKEHSFSEAIDALAQYFKLNENDRKELLPSGKQRKFDNRVSWARTYLQKALLLSSTGRSKFCITERGIKTLQENLFSINVKYLEHFPEFVTFHSISKKMAKHLKTIKHHKKL